ncbi:MAG TPA: ABC transporter substrate-binding protein, partial [Methylomirabilota bacterium]|nr:ABC transporter substrate-binding protein [Methylomirabilota bacterium]
AGGIKGVGKIEVIVEDDGSKPTEAVNATNKLLTRDKIDFLMGSCSSATTLAMVPIHTRAQMINLNSCSSSKLITDPLPDGKPNPWIFRTQYRSDRTAAFVGEFAIKELGAKKVGVLNDTNEYGRAAAEGAVAHLKHLGQAEVVHETYNSGDKTFSAQLLKFKEAGIDTIAYFGYYQEAALILKQAKQLGLKLRMVTTDVLHTPVFVELAGDDSNGVLVTTAFTKDTSDPRAVKFTETYQKMFGKEANGQAAMGYDAVHLMKWAYEKAGTKDKTKVREALASVSGFAGVTGETKFNERGDDMRPFLVTVISNGKWIPYDEWVKGRR